MLKKARFCRGIVFVTGTDERASPTPHCPTQFMDTRAWKQ